MGREDPVHLALTDRADHGSSLVFFPHGSFDQCEAEAARSIAVHFQSRHGECVRRVIDQENSFQARDELAKDLHSLRHELNLEIRDPGDVSTGSREALREPCSYRVGRVHEDDRDPGRRHLGSLHRIVSSGNNEIHPVADEGAGGFGELGDVALCEAHADDEILVLAVSKLLKTVA